jgi:hypothetical protein
MCNHYFPPFLKINLQINDAQDCLMCSHRYTSYKCPGPVYSDFREVFPISSHNCKMRPEANISHQKPNQIFT